MIIKHLRKQQRSKAEWVEIILQTDRHKLFSFHKNILPKNQNECKVL